MLTAVNGLPNYVTNTIKLYIDDYRNLFGKALIVRDDSDKVYERFGN